MQTALFRFWTQIDEFIFYERYHETTIVLALIQNSILFQMFQNAIVQAAGGVEYTDCTSAEG